MIHTAVKSQHSHVSSVGHQNLTKGGLKFKNPAVANVLMANMPANRNSPISHNTSLVLFCFSKDHNSL